MERIWLKSYPAGVPAEVDIARYSSLIPLLDEAFAQYRDSPAYVSMGATLTYGQIDDLSRIFAAWLQGHGLKQGDRLAIMMPNVLQYPVVMAAALRAGLILVSVNPLYTARELAHQLKDSGARAIVILENFAATLQSALAETAIERIVVTGIGDLMGFPKSVVTNFVVRRVRKMVPAFDLPNATRFNAAIAVGRSMSFVPPKIGAKDVAVLQYTGGTTGVAKGAMLLHETLVAAALISEAWMQPGLKRKPIEGQKITICALPLYHVFAFIVCALLGMRTGALNVLIVNPRDIAGLIKEMSKCRFNTFPAVNTLFNALVNHPEFAKLDFSGLVISNGGGMAVQEAVAKKWLAITGCPIVEGYGLSETSAGVTCNPTDSTAFTGTIGLPFPNVDIRIIDDAGNDVPIGTRGEIAIKGPQVMSGYWDRPDETAKALTADGFFKSGDIGVMDERGYIKIVDRKKDMILVSGFNVYPNEVEEVVAHHPDVLECAVVGMPDKNSGEAVVLFVVKRNPALTKEALAAYCAKELTGYKRPHHIEFRSELPKTNVGKILRRELRDEAAKMAKSQAA
ncbi:MAG TPA: long-chain-fatty-acid--CoA ligase [Roseiarcus sp.]|nr:long-chain-fatty-acid--CoA ligase [Roseiarcus sp.]